MADPIYSRSQILRLYDDARRTLDPMAAVEHVAGVTGVASVTVEGVVQGREAAQQTLELA